MISKIIHQVAPRNKDHWHPMWKMCRESWEKHFSEFEMMLWFDDDGEGGIEQFVKKNYPQYYEYYKKLEYNTMQIDLARYLILHKYGGIYADMDVFCYQNFYNDLPINSLCLLAGSKEGDIVENAVIATSPNCSFFIDVVEISFDKYCNYKKNKEKYNKNYKVEKGEYILEILGPAGFSDAYYNYYEDKVLYEGEVYIMPKSLYNMPYYTYDKSYKTKHMLTGMWGTEVINDIITLSNQKNKTITDQFVESHMHHRGINVYEFDFYKNYEESELFENWNVVNGR